MEFKEITKRDAWASIRGFVYQVDATIHKWLALKEDEVLELEKGEDIDLIARDIKNQELSRELQQVKFRESNLSLNQNLVIELLFNFYLHKSKNPQKTLLFRFISNTGFTVERPAIFSDGTAGIEKWINIYQSNVSVSDWRLQTLRKHVKDKVEKIVSKLPQKNNQKVEWNNFIAFLNDDKLFLDFVNSFEWSLDSGDENHFKEEIKHSLIARHNITSENIENIYSRLFLYVFKLLSQSGNKILDTTKLRKELKESQIGDSDKVLLKILNDFLVNLGDRMTRLESEVEKNSKKITSLIQNTQKFTELDAVFQYEIGNISITLPPPIKRGSLRREKTDELKAIFKNIFYLNFQGINGTGKSQLAALVAKRFNNYYWLDLRPYQNDLKKVEILFESFLILISEIPLLKDRKAWIESVVKTIPPNTIIVLNDLPRLESNHQLTNLLAEFVNGISKSPIRLLTTSNHKWTKYFEDLIDVTTCNQYFDFEFSDEEIEEFLELNGANKNIFNFTSLIAAFSNRNPTILSAMVGYLKSINWGSNSNQVINVLLERNFSKDILDDKQRLIQKSIKDSVAKELLYRLSLITWEVSFSEIQLISEVEKRILNVNEKLLLLEDVWIQKNSESSYSVSPLILSIGERNLPVDVIQNVHLAIGNAILKEKTINEINGNQCITSLLKGKDFNKAGLVLINIYGSARNIKQAKHLKSWGYLSFWTGTPIPKEMDVLLKAKIRMEQIRLNKILGQPYLKIQEILESYLNDEGLSSSDNFLIHLQCLVNQVLIDHKKLLNHITFILNHTEEFDELTPIGLTLNNLSGLLWSPLDKFDSYEEIDLWLDLVKKYEGIQKVNFFDDNVSTAAIAVLARRLSSLKSPIKNLNKLAKYFKDRGLSSLESVVIKQIVLSKIDRNENFESAIGLAIDKLKDSENKLAKYHLNEFIGKFYFDKGFKQKSIKWLQNAVDTNCFEEYGFADTLIYLSSALSPHETEHPIKYLKKALKISVTKDELNELDHLKVLGELAIAYWLNGNNSKSYKLFSDFFKRLLRLDINENRNYWIQLFSWSSHAIGYIGAEVGKDRVPNELMDGSPYTKPYQGFLSFNTKDLSDLYNPSKIALVYSLMAAFADGVGKLKKSYNWSIKAFDAARRIGNQKVLLMVTTVSSQYALVNFKVQETLESYLLFSGLTSHFSGTLEERPEYLQNVDLKSLSENKPSKEWAIAESLTVTFAVIPLFIYLMWKFINQDKNREEAAILFSQGLETNQQIASNPDLWEKVNVLTDRIITNNISSQELKQLSNSFAVNEDDKHLHSICLLGITYQGQGNIYEGLINAIPFVIQVLSVTHSVVKNIIFPFVQDRCMVALRQEYVGTGSELDLLLEEITGLKYQSKDSIKQLLKKVYEEIDIELPISRKEWLDI
ncbi:hypothetical protein [Croceivirga radicis]|uniref:hypothetical protein n=1 Tax=Croceivirga radicis TaxID=1929488 RepID=UPI000255AF4C|nr:hypothetical protein [Croceivirga radicis]